MVKGEEGIENGTTKLEDETDDAKLERLSTAEKERYEWVVKSVL